MKISDISKTISITSIILSVISLVIVILFFNILILRLLGLQFSGVAIGMAGINLLYTFKLRL